MKKAISAATSAALLASLLATAVAPSAFAAVTVGSAGNVPVGGTSANNVSFTFTEQLIGSLTDNPGNFDVTITPKVAGTGSVSFVGTPSVVGSTGSLGAGASITGAGNVLHVTFSGSDTTSIESILITGLKIKATGPFAAAQLGAINAIITAGGGQFASALAAAAAFTPATSAQGTLSTGYASGTTSVVVNVSGTCLFAVTAAPIGTLDFATAAESKNVVAPVSGLGTPGPGQQTLTIAATGNNHQLGEAVSQANPACGASVNLASPGNVVASITYNSAGNATVFPGENNSLASSLNFVEPSAGFLAAASTFTFKILTAGVVFSTAPTVAISSGTVSPAVISTDRLSATVTVNTASAAAATVTLSNILYDVASTVPAGTFITVGLTTSAAQAVLPATNTNAVVFRGIAASAPSPTVYIGENNQTAGLITFKESAAGFFTDGVGTATNTFAICPTGVNYTFTLAPVASVTGGVAAGNVILRDGNAASTTNVVVGTQVVLNIAPPASPAVNVTCYQWLVWTASTTASTIVIGAAPSATAGGLINVSVAQAPGGVDAGLYIGSNVLQYPLTLAATVQFATAAYRNQVAVTALSQPAIAPGSPNAAAGNLQIAETALGQLKAGEKICVQVLPRSAENTIQDTFLNALNTADRPIATASGTGLVIGPVTASVSPCVANETLGVIPTAYAQSFSFNVIQQSTAGDGKLVISNINYTTTADAHLGTVLVSVWGTGGAPTVVIFHSTVSNATIGTAAAVTTAGSALGATKTGPFTVSTKVAKLGKYVTWKFSGGSALVGKTVQIWVATKNSAGTWSAFALKTARTVDASGNAYFWWKTSSKAWISVRGGYNGTLSVATQARWL